MQIEMTGQWLTDLYVICVTRLKVTQPVFLSMSILEIEHLLNEHRIKTKLERLEQAFYNACLIFNEKHLDTYNDLRNNILGIEKSRVLKRDIERYRMISERLRLKFPKKTGVI